MSTVIFDQVYRILESNRLALREAYDKGHTEFTSEILYFYMDNDTVILSNYKSNPDFVEETEDLASCVLSCNSNNADLRTLARDVMFQLI